MRVGYLGPPGTYSHEAVLRVQGAAGDSSAWTLVAQPSVHAAVLAVQAGEVDRALVPIENSLEGSVNATLDALALEAPDVVIAGEVVHAVHHCLIAAAPVELSAVQVVASHPQASAQCAGFLRAELPNAAVLPAASTADAVRRVVAGPAPGEPAGPWAAIGARAAAELYGGTVLRADIEDDAGNETRFAWLAPAGSEPLDAPGAARFKTALVWWGAGSTSPGWLVRCLSEFAFRGVNLTRIESRPLRRAGIGEYMFFVDLDGHGDDAAVAEAISALRGHASAVRVLGTFPAARG
ncbi:MAG TPA: prephenate dehydratase [Solirubrobacteraceae bacterium]|jgi:prephenate dehydratase